MKSLSAFALLLSMVPAARADKLVLVAGGGDKPDGSPAAEARLIQPFGVAFLGDRILFVEMAKGERLREIDSRGMLRTLAGKEGAAGNTGDRGDGPDARFNGMHNLTVGPDGLVYLADTFNNRVRVYNPNTRIVSAFAGTGVKGFSGDGGPALKAQFGGCYCISFDSTGKQFYITDLDNHRIRRIDVATGIVSTAAGNGKKGIPKDGEPALQQPLIDPRAHAIDSHGNLYILERSGHALRVVDAKGTIRTVAGTGKAGKGIGPALAAAMNGPKNLAIDRDGSVLIADTENHRILRYLPTEGKLVAVAGTGKKGTAGLGGDPLLAELSQPHGVIVHPKTGEIYIADSSNGRILKIVK